MKKILIIVGIGVIALMFILMSKSKNESFEEVVPIEKQESAPEAYDMSFRKTESSIPPPSVNNDAPPSEESSI